MRFVCNHEKIVKDTCACILNLIGTRSLKIWFFFPAKFQNTSRPGVYALGDVCGKALLTPGKDIYSCHSQNSIPAWFSRVMIIAFKMSLIIVFKIPNFRQTRRLPNNYRRLSKDFRTLLKTPDDFPIFLNVAVPKLSTILKYDLEVRVCVKFCGFFSLFFARLWLLDSC